MMRLSKSLSAACLLSIPTLASAQAADPAPGTAPAAAAPAAAPAASADASFTLGGSSDASATAASGTGDGFWERYRPLPLALELGLYAGFADFAQQHNLQDLNIIQDTQYGHQSLSTGLDLGLRAGFYPLTFLGVEGELGVIPTKTGIDDRSATVWTYRAHAIAQYPGYRLVPFVVLGLGGMTVKSHPDTLGTDADPAMHWGLGAKWAFNEYLSARFDFRDNLMQKNMLLTGVEDGDLVHNTEFLLGLSFTLGRTPYQPTPPPVDSDGDGFFDPQDACPTQPGVAPNGCPAPVVVDSDKDGIPDASDPCPQEAEDNQAPNPTDGCPNKDLDGDGILIPEDKCPAEKGIAPDGCPVRDKDADGIPDDVDKCPDQPETKNGFEDADGCPDELPKAVAKFAGVIKGIEFDFGKATIRKGSNKLLDEAVKVLTEYKDLRVLITGFTDDVGERQTNIDLSEARANSVKAYMVSKGIDTGRIETHGAGPDNPIADNKTDKGRQQNRRIEFKLITK
jgi:outer membrane protein OmpA-like peptidoglycan-associated protein/opacity protein-like surface antigen